MYIQCLTKPAIQACPRQKLHVLFIFRSIYSLIIKTTKYLIFASRWFFTEALVGLNMENLSVFRFMRY